MNYKFFLKLDKQFNGLIPLYCIGIQNRKKKYISLKIYLKENQFDPVKQVITNHPDKVSLNLILDKIRYRVNQELFNCRLYDSELSFALFEELVKGKITNRNSFFEFAENEISGYQRNELNLMTLRLRQWGGLMCHLS